MPARRCRFLVGVWAMHRNRRPLPAITHGSDWVLVIVGAGSAASFASLDIWGEARS